MIFTLVRKKINLILYILFYSVDYITSIARKHVVSILLRFIYTVCTSGFQCDGTRCIPSDWICDGHLDCSDRTDESGCGNCNSSTSSSMFLQGPKRNYTYGTMHKGPLDKSTVSTFSLHCGEKRCMSASHICNGVMDCPWGQDERYCRK